MTWIDILIGLFAFFSISLAFSGPTIGESALAFGGDRWTDTYAPLYRRITMRGWFSLICFFIAVGGIMAKGKMKEQALRDEVALIENLQTENAEHAGRISKQALDIAELQMKLSRANQNLSENAEGIEAHHLKSLEAAFKLSGRTPRRSDEALVHFEGRASIPIPSQHFNQMRLSGGDQFYFATWIQDLSSRDLESIQLKIGDDHYSLFNGKEEGFFERTLRLPGNPNKRISAVLLNPLLLRDLTLKIFVQPRDPLQGKSPFKGLVLGSPFSAQAKKIYKMTHADVLNMRSAPAARTQLISRLLRGSYVRILQDQRNWTEVLTSDAKQGWVLSKFLSEIE